MENKRAYGQLEDYDEWLKLADALEEAGYPEIQEFRRATDALKTMCDQAPPYNSSATAQHRWRVAYIAANTAVNTARSKVVHWLRTGEENLPSYHR